jgi:hypothetical protein
MTAIAASVQQLDGPDYGHLAKVLARAYTGSNKDLIVALQRLDEYRCATEPAQALTIASNRQNYGRQAEVLSAAWARTKSVSSALRILDNFRAVGRDNRPLRSDDIAVLRAIAAQHFGIPEARVSDVDNHHSDVVHCRWALTRVLHDRGWSANAISKSGEVGFRNHASVLNALTKIAQRPDLLHEVQRIVRTFQNEREPERKTGQRVNTGPSAEIER